MMNQKIMDHIFTCEGGYSNDPDDHGGATNFGITEGELKDFYGHSVTDTDVKLMHRDTAVSIYQANYWDYMNLSKIYAAKIQAVLMDQGVNCGCGTAIRKAQELLNTQFNQHLLVDGQCGPKTCQALNLVGSSDFCASYIHVARLHYADIVTNNHSQSVFLKGWLNRLAALEKLVSQL